MHPTVLPVLCALSSGGVAFPYSGSHLHLSPVISFLFLKKISENWGCSGTLGSAQSKLFSTTLLLLLLLEAAQGFILASAPSLLCRGGTPGFVDCAPLMWVRQEPCCIFLLLLLFLFFLMMSLQSEISIFQSWQEQPSACLFPFPTSFLLLPAQDAAGVFVWCWMGATSTALWCLHSSQHRNILLQDHAAPSLPPYLQTSCSGQHLGVAVSSHQQSVLPGCQCETCNELVC